MTGSGHAILVDAERSCQKPYSISHEQPLLGTQAVDRSKSF